MYNVNYWKYKMKNIKLSLLNALLGLFLPISSAGQIYTNGVYLENGKTIEIDKSFHEITPTNSSEILYFSNELIIKVNTNSDFTINSFYQDILNTNSQPEKIKSDNHNFASTLNRGSIIVTYNGGNENSSCVISTPLTDNELSKGTFYFQVTDNNVVVFVLDGHVKSTASSRNIIITQSGHYTFAVPNSIGILEEKISFKTDSITPSIMNKLISESKDVTDLKGSIIFIRVDGKTWPLL